MVQAAQFGYRCGDAWRPTFRGACVYADSVIDSFERLGYKQPRKTIVIEQRIENLKFTKQPWKPRRPIHQMVVEFDLAWWIMAVITLLIFF